MNQGDTLLRIIDVPCVKPTGYHMHYLCVRGPQRRPYTVHLVRIMWETRQEIARNISHHTYGFTLGSTHPLGTKGNLLVVITKDKVDTTYY
jgi:hypothetical protein